MSSLLFPVTAHRCPLVHRPQLAKLDLIPSVGGHSTRQGDMPIMASSRKRSRGNVEQVRTFHALGRYWLITHLRQGPGGNALTGWEFIQEKILSHDEDMIADHADDIDTLLVFVSVTSIDEVKLPCDYG